jgi:hypothetical protein
MTSFSEFFPLVSNLGAVGLIFWLVWRSTNTTLPKMAANFEKSLRDERCDFRTMLQEQRDDLLKVISEHTASTARLAESTALHVKEAVVARAEISQREREFFDQRIQKEHSLVMAAVEMLKKSA